MKKKDEEGNVAAKVGERKRRNEKGKKMRENEKEYKKRKRYKEDDT